MHAILELNIADIVWHATTKRFIGQIWKNLWKKMLSCPWVTVIQSITNKKVSKQAAKCMSNEYIHKSA